MQRLEVLSTDSFPDREKAAFWNHVLYERMGICSQVEELGAPFHAQLEQTCVDGIGMFRLCTSGGYLIERTRELASSDNDVCVKLALVLDGSTTFIQRSRDVTLGVGDWTLLDNHSPYRGNNPSGVRLIILTIPATRLASKIYCLEEVGLRRYRGGSGVNHVAIEFIKSVFDEVDGFPRAIDPDIGDTITNLIRLSLSGINTGSEVIDSRAALRNRIREYVSRNLRNPELDIGMIATALHCTPRYLHKAFASERMTISEFIWQSRLVQCKWQMDAHPHSKQSITDIAFAWGFNTTAHFSTLFRAQFGTSPRDYRKLLANAGKDSPAKPEASGFKPLKHGNECYAGTPAASTRRS